MAMHTRLLPRLQNPLRRLRALSLGFVVTLFAWAITVQAADYIPAGQPIPTQVKWVNPTVGGAGVRGSFAVENQLVTRSFATSAGTLGRLAGAFLKRASPYAAAALTLKSLIDSAGWAIDELTKQVTTQPTAGELGPMAWCTSAHMIYCSSDPTSMAAGFSQNGYTCSYYMQSGSETFLYSCVTPSGSTIYTAPSKYAMPAGGWEAWGTNNLSPDSAPTPIAEADLGQLIKANPEVVNAVMIDPDTGAPIRFPELVEAMNNLRKEIEAANGLDPGPDVVVDPDWGTTPTEVQGPQPTQLPEFCSWAGVVCEWLNWTRELPDPEEPMEVPEEELDLETPMGWDSGLGNGSCPAPVSTGIVVGPINETVEFTFQPLCDLADLLRPLFLACAAIVAAFIIGGARRA